MLMGALCRQKVYKSCINMSYFLGVNSGLWMLGFWAINPVNASLFYKLSLRSLIGSYGAMFLANVFLKFLSGVDPFISAPSEIALVIGKGRISIPVLLITGPKSSPLH